METPLQLTKEFHEAFDIYLQDTPGEIPEEVKQLRINLMTEELKEVIDAMKDEPLEHVAKELADLTCAIYGTVLSYGMADQWNDIFSEMTRSNMSKLDEDGNPIKREDGKILKGPNFSEANIVLKK